MVAGHCKCTLVIPASGRLRQEDGEFEVSLLCYIARHHLKKIKQKIVKG
jgi:hypothetical protein